jgi:uncharacterized protein YfaS (alpha-2-macroglobulin family)
MSFVGLISLIETLLAPLAPFLPDVLFALLVAAGILLVWRKTQVGSKRIIVAAFLLLNGIGLAVVYHVGPVVGGRRALLAVESFAPASPANPMSVVQVRFNVDMVAPDEVGEPVARPLLAIKPLVAGRTRWVSRRAFEFRPDKPFEKATEYKVDLVADRLTAGPLTLGGQKSFAFRTTPLTLTGVQQVGFDDQRRVRLALTFDDAIVPADLEKHLTVTNDRDEAVSWSLVTRVRARELTIVTAEVNRDHLNLILSPGLTGASGPLGLEQEVRRSISLDFVLALRSLTSDVSVRGEHRATVYANFSSTVDAARAKEFIQVEPAVAFEPRSHWNGLQLVGDFAPASRYRVTFLPGLPSTDGKTLAQTITQSVWTGDVPAFVLLDKAGGYLSTRGNLLVNAKHCNVDRVRATLTRLYPNNLVQFVNQPRYGYGSCLESLGEQVAEKTLKVPNVKNEVRQFQLDLRDLLGGKPAQGVFLLEVTDEGGGTHCYWNDGPAVISVTDLGLSAKQSERDFLVWVNSLRDGRAVPDARVSLYTAKNQKLYEGQTDPNGLVHFAQTNFDGERRPALVLVERDGDLSYLKLDDNHLPLPDGTPNAGRAYLQRGYEAFCYTDRGVYRPGETVRLAAVVRGTDWSLPGTLPLRLDLRRPDGRVLQQLRLQTDTAGAASLDIPMPAYAPTGRYRAQLLLPGGTPGDNERADTLGEVAIQVEEFLPNRLRTTIEAPEKPLTADEPLTFAVAGQYLFGQPTAGLPVEARVYFSPSAFTPAGPNAAHWKGFTFGDPRRKFIAFERDLGQIDLDDQGRHEFKVELLNRDGQEQQDGAEDGTTSRTEARAVPPVLPRLSPPAALTATITATIKELGGRGVSAHRDVTVHPYPHYLGIRPESEGYGAVGVPMNFAIAAVLPDGRPAELADLVWQIERVEWDSVLVRDSSGYYRYESKERTVVETEGRVSLAAGCGQVAFTPKAYGAYRIRLADRATTTRPTTGAAPSAPTTQHAPPTAHPAASCDFYVSGRDWAYAPWAMAKPEALELTTDRARYRPGEGARLIVKSPFPGTLLLTVESDRVRSVQVLAMSANTAEFTIPVRDEYRPNVFVAATVVRAVDPNATWAAHRAFGIIRLGVDCEFKRLAVDLAPPAEMRPKSRLTVPLRVRDLDGRPARARLTLAAVDEGICSLTAFRTPDPWAFFYGDRRLAVETMDLYSRLMPENQRLTPDKSSAPGGDGGGAEDGYDPRRLSPVSVQRVKPVALWSGWVQADDEGNASVSFDVPQFVGELRLMAVAHDGDRFGSAAAPVKVKSPLLVQSSFPRFLAPGDQFEVPLTVFNQTTDDGSVDLRLTLTGPLRFSATTTAASRPFTSPGAHRVPRERGLEFPASPGDAPSEDSRTFTLSIPASGQAVLRVRLKAAEEVGQATVALSASLGAERFDESTEIPVRPAAPLTAVVGSGSVAAGQGARLTLPADFFPGTARYKLLFAGEPNLHLAGGLQYLLRYPYGCVEQTTSSCFPLLYLGDLAQWVEPGLASPGQIEHYVQSGIARVLSMQSHSGGFAYWPGYQNADIWVTCYAGQLLVEARTAGYSVPNEPYDQLLAFLAQQLDRPIDAGDLSASAADRRARELAALERKAYACYVLALGGKPSASWMTRLEEVEKDLSPTARAHLAAALAAAGRVDRAATLIGATLPSFDTRTETGGHLHSPARDCALFLSALIDVQPKSPLIPTLVTQLENQRVTGYWSTTHGSAMALVALGKYARLRAKDPPNYTATVEPPGAAAFILTQGDKRYLDGDLGGKPVRVAVQGAGALNYFWFAEGVPRSGQVEEHDRGIEVRRRFLDRKGQPLQQKPLKQGDLVVVELTLTARQTIDNLVITDLLPAGLEIENPRLETTDARTGLATSSYAERVDMRDDRLILFTRVGDGTWRYTYVTRAVTAGGFRLPPVQANAMYDPALASCHGAGWIEIAP